MGTEKGEKDPEYPLHQGDIVLIFLAWIRLRGS